MLEMAQEMFKAIQDRFRTTLRVMADLAESVGVPATVTTLLTGEPRAECGGDEAWSSPRREPAPAPAPEAEHAVEPERQAAAPAAPASEPVRALRVDDAINGSTYLARIVWALGVAEADGAGPLRPADMARMIMSRSPVSLEPPNVARYIRRSRPSCIEVAYTEGSSSFYKLNAEGKALFEELFREQALMSGRILLRDIYHLVSGVPGAEPRRGVDLLVEGPRIAAIGERLPVQGQEGERGGGTEVIDASTKLVMPGLVNAHHHMYQTLQRNLPAVQDAKLFDWLIALYEVWKFLTPEAVEVSTQLACAELLRTGCTCTVDHHYVFPQGIKDDLIGIQLQAAARVGLRFCATRGSMSRGRSRGGLPPDVVVQDEETILRESEALIDAYHDPSPLSMRRIALAPCSPFSVSEEAMREAARLARRRGVRLHTHLAETKDEESYCLEHYGCRPLALAERLEWLGPDVWFAHGVHFDDAELATLARTRTGVAHCPSSNMRLGSGIARVPEMRRLGVPVGLGVDGSASNDSSDMLGELRACLLLQRVLGGAGAITAPEVLDMATRGGAALLGWSEIGTLEPGKAADLVLVEMDRLDYAGALSDPLAAVIFAGCSHEVHTAIVGGEVRLRDGVVLGVDEVALRRDANRLAREMMDKAGHSTRWML